MFGQEVENGELPDDTGWIGSVIQDICYNNARDYFNLQHLDEEVKVKTIV
jgi:glucuronate isomerase